MVYKNSIPQGTDKLSNSQQDILNNFAQLDTSFGIDHYDFSDTSGDTGKHKKITSPDQAGDIVTAASEPSLYATDRAGTNLGVLQYSRGPSNAVPSPLTIIHSAVAGEVIGAGPTTVNIFDFAGIARALARFMVVGTTPAARSGEAAIFWDGTTLLVKASNQGTAMTIGSSGTNLTLTNSDVPAVTVHWSLQFLRTT